MRIIDWERILRDNRIPYIESGPNVKRGEMAIRCPFCGSADPSMHMGLSRETGWWSCWRNRAQHSGKSPLRLLMKLLGIPYAAARDIAGLGDDYVDPEGFDAMAAKLMGRDNSTGRAEELERRVLKLDEAFRPITQRGRTARHFDYLVDVRGFYAKDVEALGRQYGICAGVSNEYQDRVVMPYYQDGDLMTWTARAIGPSKIRYRDLEIEDSILPPKKTLFNHDCMLASGKILVLQEGPMDALKVDFYGRPYGVRSVALSTNSIQTDQAFLLQTAVGRFDQTLVMLDNASILGIVDSMRMRQELAFLPNVASTTVPFGAKDGADLTPAQIRRWAKDITSEL